MKRLMPTLFAAAATALLLTTPPAAAHFVTYSVIFSGLLGNVTASHIHCCTAAAGTSTAGVATMTPTFTNFPSGVAAAGSAAFCAAARSSPTQRIRSGHARPQPISKRISSR